MDVIGVEVNDPHNSPMIVSVLDREPFLDYSLEALRLSLASPPPARWTFRRSTHTSSGPRRKGV